MHTTIIQSQLHLMLYCTAFDSKRPLDLVSLPSRRVHGPILRAGLNDGGPRHCNTAIVRGVRAVCGECVRHRSRGRDERQRALLLLKE
jgi:hypothetical protein